MNNIFIRIATTEDASLIADISRETFYNAFAPANTKQNIDKFMNENFSKEKLMAELFLPDNIFLLAHDTKNNILGYVRMRDKSIPETSLPSQNIIEIARIYTISTETSKGIGTELMNACISIAQEKQRDYIWLGVWEHNPKAILFYQRFGFEKFGEHPFVLGDEIQTDWLMMKPLHQPKTN